MWQSRSKTSMFLRVQAAIRERPKVRQQNTRLAYLTNKPNSFILPHIGFKSIFLTLLNSFCIFSHFSYASVFGCLPFCTSAFLNSISLADILVLSVTDTTNPDVLK